MARRVESTVQESNARELVDALAKAAMARPYALDEVKGSKPWNDILTLDRAAQRKVVLEVLSRFPAITKRVRESARNAQAHQGVWDVHAWDAMWWMNLHCGYPDLSIFSSLLQRLFARDLGLSRDDWTTLLTDLGSFEFLSLGLTHDYMNVFLGRLEKAAPTFPGLAPALEAALERVAEALGECCSNVPQQRASARVTRILDELRARTHRSEPATMSHAHATESTPLTPHEEALLNELCEVARKTDYQSMQDALAVRRLWDADAKSRLSVLRAARHLAADAYRKHKAAPESSKYASEEPNYRVFLLLNIQIERSLKEDKSWALADVLEWMDWWRDGAVSWHRHEIGRMLLRHVERHDASADPRVHSWLAELLQEEGRMSKPDIKLQGKLRALLGAPAAIHVATGEVWTQAVLEDTSAASAPAKAAWIDLFAHAETATSSEPSKAWFKSAAISVQKLGGDHFIEAMVRWLPLVDKPRSGEFREGPYRVHAAGSMNLSERSQSQLKGLCWMCAAMTNPGLARALGHAAISAYKKVPGLGPRAVKVGNAAVYALGQMPGMDSLGQLAMLRVKVKFGGAQKAIEKALNAAAEREGLPRDEIEELGIPSYGLTTVGKFVEQLGDYRAELSVTGIGDTELVFFKTGFTKPQKSIPAALKTSHAEDLKDLKAAAKDIGAMLPAQRDRIDSLFLENKSWAFPVWRERYLDHPLVGVLARRLIWRIADGKGDTPRSLTWLDEATALVDVTGTPAPINTDAAIVRLWHPIEVEQSEVLAWRRFFEDRRIRQPFKQAHREVYLLTDAERRTATYSNRFAAHIIKQHQFHALAAARGWKNKLRLMVDAEYPPATRALPAFGLRAEYWVEGAGDEYGRDTNEAGAYLHLTTDQVRFYPEGAALPSAHAGGGGYGAGWRQAELQAGLPLEQVLPLVFSEIMRDTDLFVGVASVSNNPQWNDGGPGGAYRNYWWGTSFGELGQTGAGRRDLLSRLLPRLKIAPVCSLSDRFLVVKGALRTYKIHLGSGNILMEPNDQYLCIVPGHRDDASSAEVFLPFEGDRTLSIILSKAFLLAADDKIADQSITRQIRDR